MIYAPEEYRFNAPDTLDIFQPRVAEDIRHGDRILLKGGVLKKVAEVRTFEPYDSVSIVCYGNFSISSRKGEEWLVDDWTNYVMEAAD